MSDLAFTTLQAVIGAVFATVGLILAVDFKGLATALTRFRAWVWFDDLTPYGEDLERRTARWAWLTRAVGVVFACMGLSVCIAAALS